MTRLELDGPRVKLVVRPRSFGSDLEITGLGGSEGKALVALAKKLGNASFNLGSLAATPLDADVGVSVSGKGRYERYSSERLGELLNFNLRRNLGKFQASYWKLVERLEATVPAPREGLLLECQPMGIYGERGVYLGGEGFVFLVRAPSAELRQMSKTRPKLKVRLGGLRRVHAFHYEATVEEILSPTLRDEEVKVVPSKRGPLILANGAYLAVGQPGRELRPGRWRVRYRHLGRGEVWVHGTQPAEAGGEEFQPVQVAGRKGWFRTLVRHGPSADRLDIVLVAEGFSARSEGDFYLYAKGVVETLREHEPFARYWRYINVHALYAPSPGDGIGRLKADARTLFGSHFREREGTGVEADVAKIQAEVLIGLPDDVDADQIAVICNDPRDGGTAHGDTVSLSTIVDLGTTVVHELGHTLGTLGDEYNGQVAPDIARKWLVSKARPNLSSVEISAPGPFGELSREVKLQVPWAHWIEAETQVPTGRAPRGRMIGRYDEEDERDQGALGLYLGGLHTWSGIYRPRSICTMRKSRHGTFCEPCAESLILAIYERSRPVEFRRRDGSERVRLGAAEILPKLQREVRWSWTGSDPAPPGLLRHLARASAGGQTRLNFPLARLPAQSQVALELSDQTPALRKDRERLRFRQEWRLAGTATGTSEDPGAPTSWRELDGLVEKLSTTSKD